MTQSELATATNVVMSDPDVVVTSSRQTVKTDDDSTQVVVNALVTDNQICIGRRINLLHLALEDIHHITDEKTHEWLKYAINGMDQLKKYAKYLKENKIEFDLNKYMGEEFPANLRHFDPLDCNELVVSLSKGLVVDELKKLGARYKPLLNQRGKKTRRYDYLIPHKHDLMKSTIHGVVVTKMSVDRSSLMGKRDRFKLSRVHASDNSSAANLAQKDKVKLYQ